MSFKENYITLSITKRAHLIVRGVTHTMVFNHHCIEHELTNTGTHYTRYPPSDTCHLCLILKSWVTVVNIKQNSCVIRYFLYFIKFFLHLKYILSSLKKILWQAIKNRINNKKKNTTSTDRWRKFLVYNFLLNLI